MKGVSMPAAACEAPWPGDLISSTVTEAPRLASASAIVTPMIPAPRTRTCTAPVYPGASRPTSRAARPAPGVDGRCPQGASAPNHLRPQRTNRYGTALAQGVDVTSPKFAIISLVGAGCLVASGVGGYLAVRSSSPAAAAPQLTESRGAVTASEASLAAPEIERPERSPASDAVSPVRRVVARETRAAAAPVAERPAPRRPAPTTSEPPAASTDVAVARSVEAPISPLPEPVTAPVEITAPAAPLPAPVQELTIPRDAVIGIRLETAVSSATAKVEDRVFAQVTR